MMDAMLENINKLAKGDQCRERIEERQIYAIILFSSC